MKRIFLIVCVLSLFLLNGCSQGVSQEEHNKAAEEPKSIIIVDKDNVKITYTGMNLTQYLPNQPEGYMLTVGLVIENSSDTDIMVLPMDSSVNDVMKPAVSGMPLTALSGKKSITGFSFTNLEGTGIGSVDDIDKVVKIEFCLSVTDNNTLDELFRSEVITLEF